MTTGEDTHGPDYFTPVFLLPQLCNSTVEATIDYSTDETVYMVDLTVDGMTMTNHKWVTESEIAPAE